MSYLTIRSWYPGAKRKEEHGRPQARPGKRPSLNVRPVEWLGWDGWVSLQPVKSIAQQPSRTK